ncbi:MAG: hypothetical protein M0Q91_12730 [Methanoregula sp.]|jgi:hypothetical protein|nr:hypothetical protein [Methanoregula sp.]
MSGPGDSPNAPDTRMRFLYSGYSFAQEKYWKQRRDDKKIIKYTTWDDVRRGWYMNPEEDGN